MVSPVHLDLRVTNTRRTCKLHRERAQFVNLRTEPMIAVRATEPPDLPCCTESPEHSRIHISSFAMFCCLWTVDLFSFLKKVLNICSKLAAGCKKFTKSFV